jgi:hypothetical protein
MRGHRRPAISAQAMFRQRAWFKWPLLGTNRIYGHVCYLAAFGGKPENLRSF